MKMVRNSAVLLVLMAAALMFSLGGVLTADMMGHDGMMSDCPFMGITAICNMSPLQHLSQWQSTFATTLQQAAGLILLLLIAIFLASLLVHGWYRPKIRSVRTVPRYTTVEKIFDPIRVALAKGVIHSKAF